MLVPSFLKKIANSYKKEIQLKMNKIKNRRIAARMKPFIIKRAILLFQAITIYVHLIMVNYKKKL